MDIKNDIKTGFRLAADAATDIAQALVEKSRLRAKANRIKQIIKGDTELRNQAYIELGRYYYDHLRENADAEQEALCVVVDKTTARIDKASRKYLELISQSGDVSFSTENTEKFKKAVADKADDIKDSATAKAKDIKNKAKETATDVGSKVKEKASDVGSKVKEKAQDLSAKTKETVADLGDKAKGKVDDFKSFIAPDEEDDIFDDELEEMIAQQEEIIAQAQEDKPTCETATDDEESPDEFDF